MRLPEFGFLLRGDEHRPTAGLLAARRVGRTALSLAESLLLAGRNVECPCCGWRFRRFAAHGDTNQRCPRCWSLARTRGMLLYLREEGMLDPSLRVLHIAPEEGLFRQFHANRHYVTGDLIPGIRVQRPMDVEKIPYGGGTFDLILCSHVLEHVTCDHRALAEFYRVLVPGGVALLQHPLVVTHAATREDPTVIDPADRLRLFGQDDHVRLYGRDFSGRVTAVGFALEQIDVRDRLSGRAQQRLGIFDHHQMTGALIFRATKV